MYNVIGLDDLEGMIFARCSNYEKARKAKELLEREGFAGMLVIEKDGLSIDTLKINEEVIRL